LAERVVFAFLVVASVLVDQYLFGFYQDKQHGIALLGRRKASRWDFSPEMLGGFSYRGLILISVLSLFLELLIIRWISSEIAIFAYFKNFVLIACFLGFGIGCYLSRKKINLLAFLGPLAFLVLVVKIPSKSVQNVLASIPRMLGSGSEVHIWGVPELPRTWQTAVLMGTGTLAVVPLFTLIVFLFIPVGQLVGWYLESSTKGIKTYTVNLIGSCAGILLYTIVCFFYQPPAIWLLLTAIMVVAMLWPIRLQRWTALVVLGACVAISALPPAPTKGGRPTEYWSPYQKLKLLPDHLNGDVISYELTTNGSWYQHVIDLSDSFVHSHPQLFGQDGVKWNAYNVPYRFYQAPSSVLVLGSGMGNDVAAALRNGAQNVTAVEIDPLILQLGRDLHFEHPYQSPKVHVVVDDARSFIQNSNQQFDLIVFSLLDSHTTASHYTNIRIDNFVYTFEALQAARRLLKPDGLLVIKFEVQTPWIAGRLNELLNSAFLAPPLALEVEGERYSSGGEFYIAGSQERIKAALTDPALDAFVQTHSLTRQENAALTTDNWPYFYQHEPGLPFTVIVMSSVIVLVFYWFLRRIGGSALSLEWHFFFLGSAFLLLEAQIISKMALLFGTTWVVNSIVISFLLLLIVLSNAVVERWPAIPVSVAYGGIFISATIAYAIPIEKFFFSSLLLKAAAATTILCLPVFFAGIVFIRSFVRVRFSAAALGSNLFGALVGGILESFSFWFGLRSLLILAIVLYAGSAFALRSRRTAAVAVTVGD
jgi:SAM-dependent methyltransferase